MTTNILISEIREFDLNRMPKESEPQNFRANASYAWDTLVGMAQDYNKSTKAINTLVVEARTLSNSITNDKNKVYSYMQTAQNAMQVATNVVIPTNATYSKEAVDEKIAVLGIELWKNTQQINKLKLI